MKMINAWTFFLGRYTGPFLTWTMGEYKHMDQRSRKLKKMQNVIDSRDDVGRL